VGSSGGLPSVSMGRLARKGEGGGFSSGPVPPSAHAMSAPMSTERFDADSRGLGFAMGAGGGGDSGAATGKAAVMKAKKLNVMKDSVALDEEKSSGTLTCSRKCRDSQNIWRSAGRSLLFFRGTLTK
jgi:hypothetical protein